MSIKKYNDDSLGAFLEVYSEKNTDNKCKPVAVGRYGIRKREDIYSKELAKDYSKNKVIYKDTMTIGMGSSQIDIGILSEDERYSVSPAYHTFQIRNISSEYLRYYLEHRNADMSKRYMIESARQGKSVDLKNMMNYRVKLCSDSEQKDIVEQIRKIEEEIDLVSDLEVKLNELVKSKFLEMFGNPIRPEKSKKLGEISLLERGRFSPRPRNDPKYYNGEFPFVQTGDVANCDHRLYEYNQTLNENGIKVSKRFETNTIMIALVGATIGATAILQKPMYAPDSLIGITCDGEYWNNIFVEVILQFWRPELKRIAPDAARANINLSILGKIPIVDTDVTRQNDFAEYVEKIYENKATLKLLIEELWRLRKSMMCQYFN